MKKYFHIVLISIFILGCAGPLKQKWQNFTAYYNTFYNARQFYNEGLQNNIRQIPELNPYVPVRVHLPPTAAGLEDFSNAIERGASILRDHPESKYVTRAIALIGRSYYYRSEFFDALEKFGELQAIGNAEEVQEAILWQGRTYLEMDAVSEGIRFLENEKEQVEEWSPHLAAEVDIVLSQLFTRQGNWELALEYMANSISDLRDRNLKARAYFLQGQLFEKTEYYEMALYSYSRIQDLRPGYDLEYNGLKKEAEVSRYLGNYTRARDLYNKMARDDKFYDYRDDLQFELARTWQQEGNPDRSLEEYNKIMQNQFQQPSRTVLAKSYFGIAEIYRDHFEDFLMAAAYFDSAASVQADPVSLPDYFNAAELAASYGEYAAITREKAELDSLLYLGSLSTEELDSVLAEIQEARAMERNRMIKERNEQAVYVEEPSDSLPDAADETEDGFLNIRNPQLVMEASLQFQAIWGDRPLTDNWRRRTEARGSRFDQPIVLTDGAEQEITESTETAALAGGIDISGIPLSDEEQRISQYRIEELNYSLANVFFLSLNMPDSAKIYYGEIVETSSQDELVTRSLYSLAEIALLEENRNQAQKWAVRLMNTYPESVYAARIAQRLEIPHSVPNDKNGDKSRYFELSQTDTADHARLAAELQLLAGESSAIRRPYILYEAAKEYMKAAQAENDSTGYHQWFLANEMHGQREDSTAGVSGTGHLDRQMADTTFAEYPFTGAYWDSTRSILERIEEYYASSEIIPQVRVLRETLKKPDRIQKGETGETVPPVNAEETAILPCNEMEPPVEIAGGMRNFSEKIVFPAWAREMSIQGEIIYRFSVRPDGTVVNYEQVSSMDRSGIPQAYENAFDGHLSFYPTRYQNTIHCTVNFPINL